MTKKLYLSRSNKKICGVCGGIAQYFNIDPTVIRLLWILAVCVFGTGIIAYFICALVIPNEPDTADDFGVYDETDRG